MKQIGSASLIVAFLGLSGLKASGAPVKKVLLEEFTVSWCGQCPSASEALKDLLAKSDRDILVSYHVVNDNMSNPLSDQIESAYSSYIEGYPTVFMDREQFNGGMDLDPRGEYDRSAPFEPTHAKQLALPAQAGIAFQKMAWDAASRTITGELSVSFTTVLSGEFRIGLIVTEDNVTGGTGRPTLVNGVVKKDPDVYNTAYDQSAPSEVARRYPELKFTNDHIIGFPHAKVARASVFGLHGKSGVIPQPFQAATPYTVPFSYKVPENFDPTPVGKPVVLKNIDLVAFVARYGADINSREVLNAETASLANYLNPTAIHSPGRKATVEKGLAQLVGAGGRSYVTVRAPSSGTYTISLFNIRGVLVGTLQPALMEGANRIPVPASAPASPNEILIAKIIGPR